MPESQMPPAGWYQDTVPGSTKLRYWDGTAWTEQVMDPPPQAPVQPEAAVSVQPPQSTDKKPLAALILGIVGLAAWFLPILGLPVTLVGLILGIAGLKSKDRTLAIVGIVLSAIGLVLSIINALLGVYLLSMS